MKHLFLTGVCYLLLGATAFALETAITVEGSGRTYSQTFDSLTTGLIGSRVPYGVLYDRVPGWAGLRSGQGAVDTVSPGRLWQAWYELEQSHTDSKDRPAGYPAARALARTRMRQEGSSPCSLQSTDLGSLPTVP